jgi:hypothetical protein
MAGGQGVEDQDHRARSIPGSRAGFPKTRGDSGKELGFQGGERSLAIGDGSCTQVHAGPDPE